LNADARRMSQHSLNRTATISARRVPDPSGRLIVGPSDAFGSSW
jgi:hypothetical protein